MSFILYVLHELNTNILCTVLTIYTCLLCIDDVIMHMCQCMLLFEHDMLLYWMAYISMCYAYIICACREYLIRYLSMSLCMECLHHYIPFLIILNRFLFGDICNEGYSHTLLHSDVLSYMHYYLLSSCHYLSIVTNPNVYTG